MDIREIGIIAYVAIALTGFFILYLYMGYRVLRFVKRIFSPPTSPPVFRERQPYTELWIYAFAISIPLQPISNLTREVTTSGIILTILTVGIVISLPLGFRTDAKRRAHLRENGRRDLCVLEKKETKVYSRGTTKFLFSLRHDDGVREIEVESSEYHRYAEGESLTLIVHPKSEEDWLLEPGGASEDLAAEDPSALPAAS